jgi:hypothetical protein
MPNNFMNEEETKAHFEKIAKASTWTTATPSKVGDRVSMSTPERTKWNRFLYWLIQRPIPCVDKTYVVVETHSSHNLIQHLVSGDKPCSTD